MGASVAEMFQFVASFGPMLGELAARVEYLESRIEALEGGAARAAPGGAVDDAPAVDDESFDFMGQKISLKGMLEGAIPAGGMPGIMERLKNWKPQAAAPAAPTTPGAPAPEKPT